MFWNISKVVLLLWLSLSVLFLDPLFGRQGQFIHNEEVTVIFENSMKYAAEEAAGLYPTVKSKLEKIFGWRVNFRPTILLVKNAEDFQRLAGSKLIVAFAIPQRNLMVIDNSKMKTHPFSMEITLKHELCHLLLNGHIRRKNLPRWLDEGIAQWVSGGIAEIIMNQKRSILHEAALSGKHIRIRALTENFPPEKKALFLAYEESRSLVEYIIGHFGIDGILAILKHLKDGKDIDEAIFETLSISFDELERRWHQHLKAEITWFTYLIHNLYEILFFLAALITIYAFIKSWMKKRAYSYEED
jgi:hypothetical protein